MRGWGAESSAGGRAAGEGGIQKFKHRAACRGAFHRRAACCLKLWLRGRPGRQLCTGPKDHRFLRSAAGAGKTGGPASCSALTCPKVATIIITGAGRKTGAAGSRRLPKGWHCAAGDSSRCIAALRRRCPAKPGRALPCVSQGTISALRAGTSYFALRNAACGRQCLHRPGSHAAPQGSAAARKDIGKARCGTPQSALPPAPLTGEPFRRQSPKSLPCKGRWMRRKAQTEGCIAALRRRWPAKPGETMPYVS